MKTPKVLVCLATGTEELEAVTVMDIMVRAGFEMVAASCDPDGELLLTGSRGIKLVADVPLVKVADEEFDCIVLPGGVDGATTLGNSALIQEMISQQQSDDHYVAAICAAPALVLQKHDFFPNAYKTCHPGFIDAIPEARRNSRRVVHDKEHKLITSLGPGSALEFAVEIVYALGGKEKALEVVRPMTTMPSLNYEYKFTEGDA
ncbi:DJ-1/PfpI family protein [Parasalinivibrio latis]|uniref:DJ-1 family glyoxalase III n=1 Tax=Parasalinivibrio latis TaxID=2952610 RepID=UPI0030E119BC